MSQVDRPRRRVLGPLASLGVWALLALIAWLDSDGCALALRPGLELHTAHVFALIVAGIQALAGYLATAAEVTATYLAAAVSWLAGRVTDILKSTGAMFAKVWDASKIVWSDVLKPALKWLDTQLVKLHTWLKTTFQPVFEWLKRVRTYLQDVYKRFVRPVIDTIEFIRALNRVLLSFHITVLQQVDLALQKLEQRIEEPFLWIYKELTAIWGWVDRIVDLDGVLQRVALIKSMAKYWPDWSHIFVNARKRPVSDDEFKDAGDALAGAPLTEVRSATAAALLGEGGPYSGFVEELSIQIRNDLATVDALTTQAARSG
jgi:hypothetical protein